MVVQTSSGFVDYSVAPAYPDGYKPTPASKGYSGVCYGTDVCYGAARPRLSALAIAREESRPLNEEAWW
eukprot:1993801-Rhodomonas_salina.1